MELRLTILWLFQGQMEPKRALLASKGPTFVRFGQDMVVPDPFQAMIWVRNDQNGSNGAHLASILPIPCKIIIIVRSNGPFWSHNLTKMVNVVPVEA